MTEVDQALSSVRDRADQLMSIAPGRVDVSRIHRLEDVRVLLACRELLSTTEAAAIARTVVELRAHLQGIVSAPPRKRTIGERLMDAMAGNNNAGSMAQGGAKSTFEANQAARAIKQEVSRLAPKPLLDAAEAWLVATITADRVDQAVDVLIEPWENATVTPHEAG